MKYGFIGAGNMGGAILRGALNANIIKAEDVNVFGVNGDKLKSLEMELGISPYNDIAMITAASDVVFLGFKPQMFDISLPQVAAAITEDKIIISMAAGISINYMENILGQSAKIIRIMPNTPAQVGCSMTSVSRNSNVTDEDMQKVWDIFSGIGLAEEVPEELIHCVIGASGSSPAFTYMYIEALVKNAVAYGMRYEQAVNFVCQAVIGAAEMVRKTGVDIEQLRVNVCSPGGTTIEGVNKLFELGFQEAATEAFDAAAKKSALMTK